MKYSFSMLAETTHWYEKNEFSFLCDWFLRYLYGDDFMLDAVAVAGMKNFLVKVSS